jgi:hypothetical protein
MKVLLLTGLGALFLTYYWDDNFDPGECSGWGREDSWGLSCLCPKPDHPCSQPASREPVCC